MVKMNAIGFNSMALLCIALLCIALLAVRISQGLVWNINKNIHEMLKTVLLPE